MVEDSGVGPAIPLHIAGGFHGFQDGGGLIQPMNLYNIELLYTPLTVRMLNLMHIHHICHTDGTVIDEAHIGSI